MAPDWRYILHCDLDAFYASVEQLDNPQLRGKPVVVGGPPESRGVVAAASYEARKFGIHSAMPMGTAMRLCPDVVRVPARFERYRQVSHQVMGIYRAVTALVEPLSLDEAYLDVTSHAEWPRVQSLASGIKAQVREATGLAVTVGGGTGKVVAKVASRLAKPDGLLLVAPGEERRFLAPLGVGLLFGVGPRSAETLRAHGIVTIGDLASAEDTWLRRSFGRRGSEMKARAQGIDPSPVEPHREAKSISSETTLALDTGDEKVLTGKLHRLVSEVVEGLRAEGLRSRTVLIKLRLADFETMTRQRTLLAPTDDPEVVLAVATELLKKELQPGRKFRLVGVGLSNLHEEGQLPLFTM